MEPSGTEMDSLPPACSHATTPSAESKSRSISSRVRGTRSVVVHNLVRCILSGAALPAIVPSALAASPAPFAGADADAEAKIVLVDIKPQAMTEALTQWAQQTGFQVLIPEAVDGAGQLAVRVKGRMTPLAALQRLLEGTTLTYQLANARTVAIRPPAEINVPVLQADHDAYSAGFADNAADAAGQKNARSAGYGDTRLASLLVDEVVVAGTHIRGGVSAGSRVQLLDQSDIDASGYTTIQDVMKSVPANLGGGPNEYFSENSSGNFNRGTGINLRGLGSDATLVLVNGRRQAGSGTVGSFVDVSSIPASAVSRIEVLTDGASAIYGSDAVGGVVNIVLRNDFEGDETRARVGMASGARERTFSQVSGASWDEGSVLLGYQYYDREALRQHARAFAASIDKRNLGGDDFRFYLSNPGNILNPLTGLPAYAIPSGQDGTVLQVGDLLPGRVNLEDFTTVDLLPQQRMHSAFFDAQRRIGERLTLSADGRYSRREASYSMFALPAVLTVPRSNPFFVDPFGGYPVALVAYSFMDDFGPITAAGDTDTFSGTAEAALSFGRTWHARLTATHGEESMNWHASNSVNVAALLAALADPDPATAFNPFGDGSHTNPDTLKAIREVQQESSYTTLENFTLAADGSLLKVWGGDAKLAVGVDYREEGLRSRTTDFRRLERSVVAVFGELAVPIVGVSNARPGARQIDLSVAARYEDYSDFGSSMDPRIGLTWAPVETVKLRGNWGTSFRAPGLAYVNERSAKTVVTLGPLPDPQSPAGQSLVLLRAGNNANLSKETASVWNAGVDFMLPGEKAPTVSLTYFDIDYRDRIAEGGPPGAQANILFQQSQWAELIERAPSREQVEALCNGPQFKGDIASCLAAPIAAIVDLRRRNLGALRVRGLDLSFSRPVATDWGELGFGLEASYMLDFDRAVNKQAPFQSIADTVGNALALRLRGSFSWQRDEWSANLFVNHTGDYIDDISRPNRRVPSWTSFDMRMAYQTPARSEWLGNVEISLNATNLFDKDPPFVNSYYGFDAANFNPLGRMISARVTKWW